MPDAVTTAPPAARPAPLRPLLAFAWINSLGTGAVTNGVFFITDEQYAFGRVENLLVALLMGAVYIVGAAGVGPAVRALARRSERVTTRGATVAIVVILALSCALPLLTDGQWGIWAMVAIYAPFSGALWPVVEAYLSGGRRDRSLRRVTSAFNFCWASAVVVALWAMGPLLVLGPLLVIAGLGVMHVVSLALLAPMPVEPPRHVEEGARPHPPVYERLLPVFRLLLTLSYVLLYVVTPVLPAKMTEIGLDLAWKPVLASTWATTRIGMFVLFGLWHGWHGRWRTVFWTCGLMLAGFAWTALATTTLGLFLGLALLGVGFGGIYASALYYAMEVGAAEVDAGGAHEAMIGLGYAVGPLVGLSAVGLSAARTIEPGRIDEAMVLIAALLALAAVAWAWRVGRARPQE